MHKQHRLHLKLSTNITNVGRFISFGPRLEKKCLRVFANNKCADQHARSLISAFVIRYLEIIISNLVTGEISIF